MANNRLEKIGIYLAVFGIIFMFWQAWRDIHVDLSATKERCAVLEVKLEYLKGNYPLR